MSKNQFKDIFNDYDELRRNYKNIESGETNLVHRTTFLGLSKSAPFKDAFNQAMGSALTSMSTQGVNPYSAALAMKVAEDRLKQLTDAADAWGLSKGLVTQNQLDSIGTANKNTTIPSSQKTRARIFIALGLLMGAVLLALVWVVGNGILGTTVKDVPGNAQVQTTSEPTPTADNPNGNKFDDFDTPLMRDTSGYSNLEPGKKYTAVGQFIDKTTGEVLASDTKTFTATKSSGKLNFTYKISRTAPIQSGTFFYQITPADQKDGVSK